jgi:hypothetical protein
LANINNIVIDLGAGTAVLTVTNGGNPVETITYTNSSTTISFSNRSVITISAVDFLSYLSQLVIFQKAILANFSVNQFATIPYTELQTLNNNNTGAGTWQYYGVAGYAPLGRIVDYTSTLANVNTTLNNRQFSLTANFAEWIFILQDLSNYYLQIKGYFNL